MEDAGGLRPLRRPLQIMLNGTPYGAGVIVQA